MSERRESTADEKYQRLVEFERGTRVEVAEDDPLNLYNHFAKQYADPCNRVGEATLDYLPVSSFYAFWMKRWWTRLRADQSIFFMIFSLFVSFLVGFVPLVNLLHFIFWIITWLYYERAAKVHRVNTSRISVPFENMVYAPEVCRRAALMNVYYELSTTELKTFGLKNDVISRLSARAKNGQVMFMVYNKQFRGAWAMFGVLRVFHILNLLLVVAAIVLANVWLYPLLDISEVFISL